MKKGYVTIPEGQIHYIEEGQGDPLLLFHQAPLSSAEWQQAIPLLSPHFRVIAPDMIGHGNSDDPVQECEMADFTRTTLSFMDALGIDRAIVCGNHSGGALALSLAVNAPERVEKVILSAEMMVSAEEIAGFLEQLKSQPMSRDFPMTADGAFLSVAWARYAKLAPEAPLDVRFRPFIIGQAARERPYDAHYAVLEWMAKADWVGRVHCPALVFGSELDLFDTRALLEKAPELIVGCQTTLIEGAGAMVGFEKPAELATAILDFLKPELSA